MLFSSTSIGCHWIFFCLKATRLNLRDQARFRSPHPFLRTGSMASLISWPEFATALMQDVYFLPPATLLRGPFSPTSGLLSTTFVCRFSHPGSSLELSSSPPLRRFSSPPRLEALSTRQGFFETDLLLVRGYRTVRGGLLRLGSRGDRASVSVPAQMAGCLALQGRLPFLLAKGRYPPPTVSMQ